MKTQLLTLVLFAACTTPKEVPQPKTKADTVKPGAPSSLENPRVSEGSAHLEVRFEGAGENVGITVFGIEGLTVTSEPIAVRTVKSGDVLPLDVTFTGTGHVVVTVQGTFNGAVQSRVHTVRVGPLKPDGAKTQVTNDGDTVKLLP